MVMKNVKYPKVGRSRRHVLRQLHSCFFSCTSSYCLRRLHRPHQVRLHWVSIVTARKRRLGQGNVFTPVCDSFCSQGREGCYDVLSVMDSTSPGPHHWTTPRILPAETSLDPLPWTAPSSPINKRPVRILLECFVV